MMRNLPSGLRPAADLVLEGCDTPERAELRRRAAIAVASRAQDAEDCALLLEMLGLHSGGGRRTEVA